jgi:anti-anti-sigma factor
MGEDPDVSNVTSPVTEAVSMLSRVVVSEHALEETLHQVATLARSVSGADMAGVSLVSKGAVRATAVTDPEVERLDLRQLQTGGPSLHALQHQTACSIELVAEDQRWPELARYACPLGIASALSVPVTRSGQGLGALNLYAKRPSAFDSECVETMSRFAEQAAVVLANSKVYWEARRLTDNLSQAMRSRATIDHAIGVLMARGADSPDDAFQLLVRISQRQNRKLRDIAAEIVRRVPSSPGRPRTWDVTKEAGRWPAATHIPLGPRRPWSARPLVVSGTEPGDGPRPPVECQVLAVSGELDLASAPELRRRVSAELASGTARVELDLGGVEFVDAAGLRALVELSEAAAAAGTRLVVRTPSPSVCRLVELVHPPGLSADGASS